MDPVSHLLRGVGARTAFVLRCSLAPPWSMRIEDEAPVSVVALVRGHAWIVGEGDDGPVLLRAGDVAVARGPRHYRVADAVATPDQVRVGPGQTCTVLDRSVPPMTGTGVRTWGNAPEDAETLLLDGTYESAPTVGQRLLSSLPELLVVPREHVPSALVDLLAAEAARDEPGQEVVLDRLLDLVLVAVLRWWFAERHPGGPNWYRAHGDPVVGRALRLMEDEPAAAWTVAGLAGATGLSRAAFSRRFTALVGEPPMTFLAGWRLALAADLLAEPGATVAAVARAVGYGTPFAFSTAFTRRTGVSPRAYRDGRR